MYKGQGVRLFEQSWWRKELLAPDSLMLVGFRFQSRRPRPMYPTCPDPSRWRSGVPTSEGPDRRGGLLPRRRKYHST